MTREEAMKYLTAKLECLTRSKGFREKCDTYNSYEGCYECDLAYKQGNIGEQIESLKLVIQALEQESKTGHWIDDNKDEIDAQYGRHLYRCQICNKYADYFVGGTEDWWDVEKPNYCPNCGCRIERE